MASDLRSLACQGGGVSGVNVLGEGHRKVMFGFSLCSSPGLLLSNGASTIWILSPEMYYS